MITKLPRRFVMLAAGVGAVLALAACDSATSPDAGRRALKPVPHFDDDSTTCLNGWIIVTGHLVCE